MTTTQEIKSTHTAKEVVKEGKVTAILVYNKFEECS